MTHYWWRERIGRDYGHAYRVTLIYEEYTPAGQFLQVFKNSLWGRFLVLDGIVQFTERDEFIYHETIVYTPLASLSSPAEEVLIIGGGDGGVLRELQKVPEIKKILQVELDLSVFEVCHKYLAEISGNYEDPRVELRIEDGLSAVRSLPAESFDLVIVDCTDPVGPAKSLYTADFYKELRRILKPWGTFIQQASLPGFFPHILREAYALCRQVFPKVEVLRAPVPCYGDEIAFILGLKDGLSSREPRRSFWGRFYNPAIHQASLALPSWWQDLLKAEGGDDSLLDPE